MVLSLFIPVVLCPSLEFVLIMIKVLHCVSWCIQMIVMNIHYPAFFFFLPLRWCLVSKNINLSKGESETLTKHSGKMVFHSSIVVHNWMTRRSDKTAAVCICNISFSCHVQVHRRCYPTVRAEAVITVTTRAFPTSFYDRICSLRVGSAVLGTRLSCPLLWVTLIVVLRIWAICLLLDENYRNCWS